MTDTCTFLDRLHDDPAHLLTKFRTSARPFGSSRLDPYKSQHTNSYAKGQVLLLSHYYCVFDLNILAHFLLLSLASWD